MNYPHLRRLAPAVLAAAILSVAPARGQTWIPGSGDWNAAGNWSPAIVPNTTTATVNFTVSETATVNISASILTQTLNFANAAGSYTLTSGAGVTLSSVSSIIVQSNVTGTEMINLANVTTGSLLFMGNLAVTNDSTSSATTLAIGPNTVIGTPGSGSVIVAGPGNTQISGTYAASPNNVVGGLSKSGPGTLTFSGSGASLTGGLGLFGGTLVLDYSTNTASKLSNVSNGSDRLILDNGALSLTANSGTPVTQTISDGTIVTFGHTDVKATGTGTITLAAGAIIRSAGGTVDFALVTPPTFNVNTSTATANSLLGTGPAFATANGGSTWATVSGGSVAPLNTYGTNTFTPGTNVDVTVSSSQSGITANSLRFNTGSQTLTLSGTNMLQSGGVLVTPSATGATITGGTLTGSGGTGELLFHTYGTGPLIINSALVSTAGLTKTGPGTLTLEAGNPGLTGPINVNRGGLAVTTTAAVNSASAINFNDDRLNVATSGLQQFVVDLGANSSGTISPPISVSAFSLPSFTSTAYGTVFSTGVSIGSRVTLSGVLSSGAGLTTPIRFTGLSSNTSGFNLTNTMNSFTGNVSLFQGYLGIAADACLGNAANTLILDTFDANSGGLEFLNSGVTVNRPIDFNSASRVVSDGTDINTIAGTVTSANAAFVKGGTGTLVFSGNGAGLMGGMTLSGGTLQLNYASNTVSKLGGGLLTLNGGVLNLVANTSVGLTQNIVGNAVANTGHTDIVASSAGGGTFTLNLNTLSRSAGGGATMDVSTGAGNPTFTVQTTTSNTDGLLGFGPAFATFGGGSTWATNSAGSIAGVSSYGTNNYTSGVNVDVTATSTQTGITANSLRFNSSSGSGTFLTFAGTNTLQSGGILVTPSFSGGLIQGGTLTAPSAGELLVHVYSTNGITINSALVSTVGLTKTGPDLLTIAGNNTGLTGQINVNRGSIDVQATAAVNSASAINFNDIRPGTQLQTLFVDLGNGVNGTISPPIRVSAFSATDYGTYFSTGFSTGSTVTLGGVISSANGQTTPIRFTNLTSINTSGFNLTNTNTFTGNVSLQQGSLGITSDASLGNAANTLTLETSDPSFGGLVFLNTGVTVARPVILNAPGRIVSNGTDSNTISGIISGSPAVFDKDGTGTLTLTNPNNTFATTVVVNAGTLSLGATGSMGGGNFIIANLGATFSPATASSTGIYGTVTLNGGTLRVPSGTGQAYFVNQIVTNGNGGTVDFTGAGADTLVLVGLSNPAIITVNGNSTWLSPANNTAIVNNAPADIPVTIPPGVTLTNGIALETTSGFGFRVTGGGTLFQNSDAINVLGMHAPVTVVGPSRFRVIDASSNGGVGNLGDGSFTLDGGTFDYGGPTATTSKFIFLTANGGTVQIESAATTLTDNGAFTGSGPLTKIGPGTLNLIVAVNNASSLTVKCRHRSGD